jgi:hypothetical protein
MVGNTSVSKFDVQTEFLLPLRIFLNRTKASRRTSTTLLAIAIGQRVDTRVYTRQRLKCAGLKNPIRLTLDPDVQCSA